MAGSEHPDAILLDAMMPGLDGPATLRRLRGAAATASIPVVFLTGSVQEVERAGYIAMGAAGWHICIDVLDRSLAGHPIGRAVGPAAMQIDGFQRLHAEYAKQFKVEMPSWSTSTES